MNRSLILTGFALMISMLMAAETKTDWQVYELWGKVRSVESIEGAMSFNSKGFLETTVLGNPEYPDGSGVYTYDNKGRLILRIENNNEGEEIYRCTFTYNDRGLLEKKLNKDTYGSDYDEFTYNPDGQVIWSKSKALDGSLLGATEYLYAKSGKLIRENSYSEEMTIWQIKVTDYDKKDKLLEMREYTMPDSLNPVAIHRYDSHGLETEHTYFRKDRSCTTWKSSYDEHGNMTSRITMPEASKYDVPMFVRYEYDKKGNWTKRDKYQNGNLVESRTRSIIYY
jgi:hypothetical protein